MAHDIQVLVPSRGRAATCKTPQTLRDAGVPFTLVLTASDPDLPAYKSLGFPVHVYDVNGIAAKRQAMLARAKGKVLMIDDDLRFLRRLRNGRFRHATPQEVARMVREISTSLDTYAHVGIADYFMAHTLPRRHKLNARYNQVNGYNKTLFPKPHPTFRIHIASDYDMILQLLSSGRDSCVLTEWSKQTVMHAAGGLSLIRTRTNERRSFKQLAALWPGIVKVWDSEKDYSGLSFSVAWKKARAMAP